MDDIKQRIRDAAARNEALLATLAETDHAAPDLEQHIRFLADVEFQVSESDARVRELEALRKKELKDHEKYNNSVMRRFFYKVGGKGDKFDAKAAREEREYFDAMTAEHRERVANVKLHAQLEAGVVVKEALVGFLNQHKAAQDELDNLYNSIFAGPSGPSFPDEDEKEQDSNEALQEYHNTRTQVECEQQAVRLLGSALEQMTQAGVHMTLVLDHRCVDLWTVGSVHSIHDVTERNMLSDAAAALAHARNLIVQASRFSPFVQPDAVPPVNLDMGDLMAEVIFGNVFTDMVLHMQVREALVELERAEGAARQELAGTRGRLSGLEGELRGKERRLAETREALLEVRMQAFKRVAEEMERRDSQVDGQQEQERRNGQSDTADGQQDASVQQPPVEDDDGWWRSGLSGEVS